MEPLAGQLASCEHVAPILLRTDSGGPSQKDGGCFIPEGPPFPSSPGPASRPRSGRALAPLLFLVYFLGTHGCPLVWRVGTRTPGPSPAPPPLPAGQTRTAPGLQVPARIALSSWPAAGAPEAPLRLSQPQAGPAVPGAGLGVMAPSSSVSPFAVWTLVNKSPISVPLTAPRQGRPRAQEEAEETQDQRCLLPPLPSTARAAGPAPHLGTIDSFLLFKTDVPHLFFF